MKKENISEAIIIRIVIIFLILTALTLKTVAKIESVVHLIKAALHPEWENESQLASSNRQSNL